jgi:hypothetical protein
VLRIRIGHDAALTQQGCACNPTISHIRSFFSPSTFSQNHRTVLAIILPIFAFQRLSIAKKPQIWTG